MTDNTFILDLKKGRTQRQLERSLLFRIIVRTLTPIFKFINKNNSIIKLAFAVDSLNDDFGIRSSFRFKENMLKGYMTNVEQAINIYHLLVRIIEGQVEGDIVELGCHAGTTAVLLRKTLDEFKVDKSFHVYDSFKGLPAESKFDGGWKEGMLATSKESLIENFQLHNAELPIIHVGWFSDTLPEQLPEKVAFAHLDGDFYSSIKESLFYVYPKLSKGAIVVVDDYCDPTILPVNNILPGVKKACDEFLADKPEQMNVLFAGSECHGYFKKL